MRCSAFHEAAHAVIGELSGHPVQTVTVHADAVITGGQLVHGGDVLPGLAGPQADEHSYPTFLAAGWAGELLYGQDPATADLHCSGDDETLRMLGHGAEIVFYRKRAHALLLEHEAAWRRVAVMLEAGGVYSGVQVRAAMLRQVADPRLSVAGQREGLS